MSDLTPRSAISATLFDLSPYEQSSPRFVEVYDPAWSKIEREVLSSQPASSPPEQRRRYSRKGHASGWIEERHGNLKRPHPSTSYYYCWQEGEHRNKTYIPVRQMTQIRAMVDRRCSVEEILQTIEKRSTQ